MHTKSKTKPKGKPKPKPTVKNCSCVSINVHYVVYNTIKNCSVNLVSYPPIIIAQLLSTGWQRDPPIQPD